MSKVRSTVFDYENSWINVNKTIVVHVNAANGIMHLVIFWSQFTLTFQSLSHVNITEMMAIEDEAVQFKNSN